MPSRKQKKIWAFRYGNWRLEAKPQRCQLVKTRDPTGSFSGFPASPLMSFQGNTGIQALFLIINGLSQDVKVHNFASFPTAAGSSHWAVHYHLQEARKSSPYPLPSADLGSKKHPPFFFVCEMSGFYRVVTYSKPLSSTLAEPGSHQGLVTLAPMSFLKVYLD